MNEAAKKRRSCQIFTLFADNGAGFFGVFPDLPPDLNSPASSAFLSFHINLLRRRASVFFLKKEIKNY